MALQAWQDLAPSVRGVLETLGLDIENPARIYELLADDGMAVIADAAAPMGCRSR